jgi:hypothetical protein
VTTWQNCPICTDGKGWGLFLMISLNRARPGEAWWDGEGAGAGVQPDEGDGALIARDDPNQNEVRYPLAS